MDVREIYSRNALTGYKQASSSLCPTKSLNESIMIGENAADPTVAALILGRKPLIPKQRPRTISRIKFHPRSVYGMDIRPSTPADQLD